MLSAGEYARATIPHGTVGIYPDPHEICNVLGLEGVKCMIEDAKRTPQKTMFTIPSCVPAVPGFEDSGANIKSTDIKEAMTWDDVVGLGEMMNFPGILRAGRDTFFFPTVDHGGSRSQQPCQFPLRDSDPEPEVGQEPSGNFHSSFSLFRRIAVRCLENVNPSFMRIQALIHLLNQHLPVLELGVNLFPDESSARFKNGVFQSIHIVSPIWLS